MVTQITVLLLLYPCTIKPFIEYLNLNIDIHKSSIVEIVVLVTQSKLDQFNVSLVNSIWRETDN